LDALEDFDVPKVYNMLEGRLLLLLLLGSYQIEAVLFSKLCLVAFLFVLLICLAIFLAFASSSFA
jgi:hypothetical protein